MDIPSRMIKQIKIYERHGFTIKSIESAKGSHYRVIFNEFPKAQYLTANADEPRAMKNNIARFKRLARENQGA